MFGNKTFPFVICIPVYNDWEAAANLLNSLAAALADAEEKAAVVLVDDGSEEKAPEAFPKKEHISSVKVLKLRRNLGHQRAIAIGLSYIYAHYTCEAVVVMDADGQDSPSGVLQLIRKFRETGGTKVIFARRSKRAESLWFAICYQIFKILHKILTGLRVEVGNFSIIPIDALTRLMGVSELWNHYAASVFKAKIPAEKIPIPRAKRQKGRSRMDFVGLVMHGLSAMSVFGEEIGVRIFIFLTTFILFLLSGLGCFFFMQTQLGAVVPQWIFISLGIWLVILINTFVLSLLFAFVILQRRSNLNFLPLRDYQHYLMDVK